MPERSPLGRERRGAARGSKPSAVDCCRKHSTNARASEESAACFEAAHQRALPLDARQVGHDDLDERAALHVGADQELRKEAHGGALQREVPRRLHRDLERALGLDSDALELRVMARPARAPAARRRTHAPDPSARAARRVARARRRGARGRTALLRASAAS